MKKRPPLLKKGDTIGITSTARKISKHELEFAIQFLKQNGFKTKLSSCIGMEDHQFSGSDQVRIDGFNQLLNDNEVKAILCARGGYGSVRIVDDLDWQQLKKNPKWICGYSDVTILHSRINHLEYQSLHSTMPVNFESNSKKALTSFLDSLTGKSFSMQAPNNNLNREGIAEGELVGGNLSILYSTLGSQDQLKTKNKFLFIEDLDEYLYHIDRMMQALKRAGMLKDLAGLVVGGMSDMNDNTIPFGKTAEEIINETVEEYNYPVAFNFPIGHLDDNQTVMLGAKYSLLVNSNNSILKT
ncbi:MAG: LD-carboxypeptidase [Schleiferiaceae bacterium]|jgi:muramoyltetrapeptide carboxypeptidase|nr:LD-carboxypeptidase [Schleiferiaceae bacterium]